MTRATAYSIAAASILVACLAAFLSFYTVDPTQQVLVLQLDAPHAVVTEPGLHTVIPWPYQSVQYIDKRLLILEAPQDEVITEDKKRIVVDAFARWRVVDPLRFYQALSNVQNAGLRLAPILDGGLRRVLGSQPLSTMLSSQRANLMRSIRDDMNAQTASLGIQIADVRIRHADLPPQNSAAIYQRMQQERQREAAEFRAEGEEISQRIKSRADREVTVLLAEASRQSQILRGEGEAEKTKILAQAYGQDPDFFAFYRSMQAYKDALPGGNTTMVLSPNSDFFRYFSQAGGPSAAPTRAGHTKR
ncbi:MAG: protease modulator HflC [Rhizomicrobium sp.]|jgi:membrane protease subunit HflC